MKEEIWKDIKGFEGLYKISSFGQVKSFKRYKDGKILRPGKYSNGYLFVKLSPLHTPRNTYVRAYLIHRLVAETFIENTHKYPVVNHIDGNKQNNHTNNLEWCTSSYNTKHAVKIGLVDNQCKIIRKVCVEKDDFFRVFDSIKDCCVFFGFTKCWLGNYSKKNGNPCYYNGYKITILKRGDNNDVRGTIK